MKAIVVHEYGGPEVLKYEDVPRPEPREDQILVRVIGAGVNPVDGAARSQKFAQLLHIKLPAIPGYDIAGVVEKTGAKITKFKAGDPVYAYIALDKRRLCGLHGCNGKGGCSQAAVPDVS